jgi:hypothetical protein
MPRLASPVAFGSGSRHRLARVDALSNESYRSARVWSARVIPTPINDPQGLRHAGDFEAGQQLGTCSTSFRLAPFRHEGESVAWRQSQGFELLTNR